MALRFLLLFCLSASIVFGQTDDHGDATVIHTILDNTSSFQGSPELFPIESGDDIEGDFHISPNFQPNSNLCWVAHRTTNNVTVVDVENAELKTVIATGNSPTAIAFNDEYGIVISLDGQVQVFNLSDYERVKSFTFSGQPINIKVSASGKFALVAMDEVDEAVVIDLDNLTIVQEFDSFPAGIGGFSFITSNTRSHYAPVGMAISPDGGLVAVGTDAGLQICDVSTGDCSILSEVVNARQMEFSADGQKLVAVSFGADGIAYQIDVASRNLLTQISPSENINWFNGNMALSSNGDRLFVPSTNSGMYIRFDLADYNIVNTTSAVFWTDIRADREVAIAGGFNTYTIDMATGDIKGSTTGISLNTGAISKDGSHLLAMDPLRRERAELYVVTNNGIFPSDPLLLGSELEGDATYSVTYTHDGKKVLAVNSLSGTVSIIDVATKSLEKIIPLEWYEIYHVAISPDNQWAIIGERLGDQATIINLETLEVASTIFTFGDRPDQSFFHPSGDKAYILNAGSTDNISVVDFTQNPPKTVKNIVCGNMGISWINYGVRTNLSITEDGTKGILATPFDDQIQLVDLENDEIETSFDIGGFPLRSALSNEIEGKVYAAVTLRNDDKLWIAEDITGSPVAFGGLEIGSQPTQLSYDASTQRFAVCANGDKSVQFIDPLYFEIVETQTFGNSLTPLHVQFSEKGDQFTLLRSSSENIPHQLWVNEEPVELPNLPCQYFAVSPDGNTVAVPGIHTDEVYLIETNLTGVSDLFAVSTTWQLETFPNPFVDRFVIKLPNKMKWETNWKTQLLNLDGKVIAEWKGQSSPSFQSLPRGSYVLRIQADQRIIGVGKISK